MSTGAGGGGEAATGGSSQVTTTVVGSPVGPLRLVATRGVLSAVYLTDHRHAPPVDDAWHEDPGSLAAAAQQLEEYFAGTRTVFDLPVHLVGTPFQLLVWDELRTIPYGRTVTYGQLAARLGRPGASRAVGLANGRNPVSIVVPCHRVIGADGSLTGYGGGLERKAALLAHELGHGGAWPPSPSSDGRTTLF